MLLAKNIKKGVSNFIQNHKRTLVSLGVSFVMSLGLVSGDVTPISYSQDICVNSPVSVEEVVQNKEEISIRNMNMSSRSSGLVYREEVSTPVVVNTEIQPVAEKPVTMEVINGEEEQIVVEVSDPTITSPVVENIMNNVDRIYNTFEFNPVTPYEMYIYADSLNIRDGASTENGTIGSLKYGDKVTIVGGSLYDSKWAVIENGKGVGFIHSDYIGTSKPEPPQKVYYKRDTYLNPRWVGEVLNRQNGRIEGPSGQETYYNLNMKLVVKYMKALGYDYEYWVREDGVKMYGEFVMVAANLSIRPKGSLVETSLGTGMVVDTGEFVRTNPYGLDIAVAW